MEMCGAKDMSSVFHHLFTAFRKRREVLLFDNYCVGESVAVGEGEENWRYEKHECDGHLISMFNFICIYIYVGCDESILTLSIGR